ncbi:extracellular lipase [Dendrothele bispora CBS 962.96]|uniref:Carboxylic ester hydrolase n=1 Tax=Dendrothele bispora (strain CBS 962.96) TaxID=1314807 RepID=A0A4S8LFW7_DENBC|nr:extracellular lipase [Dendrothele bispora CBS 962.96]
MIGFQHVLWVVSTFTVLAFSTSTSNSQQFILRASESLEHRDDGPRVTIPRGQTYIGSVLREDYWPQAIDAFRGIPYALPPIGDRRFREAVPAAKSNETLEAQKFGPRCPGKQFVQIPGADLPESEDCLTLNVFRPRQSNPGQKSGTAKLLPVALYIHGGAFNRGTAAMHNTSQMVAWSEAPFVAVSFNYRIGALGFLPSNISAEEGILNLGLKDQIVVMEWVQENIAAFGGDPNQVTLFGLSAGAHSIGHHLMDYKRPSFFHRVIIESGAPTSRAVLPYNAALHETQFNEFLIEAGCAGLPSTGDILPCLRSQPSQTVMDAQVTIFQKYNPSLRWAFQPVIDGLVDPTEGIISQRPIDEWASGLRNRVSIMTGFSTNEGSLYVPANMSTSEEFRDFFGTLVPRLTEEDLDRIEELYPDPSTDPSSPYVDTRNLTAIAVGPQFKRAERAYANYAYICPVRQTVNLASPTQEQSVYLYHWALNKTVRNGANHGDHMEYQTMNEDVLEISETQRKMAETLHAYWTSFITMGDPNALRGRADGREVWAKYDVSDPKVMVFGEENDERAGGDSLGTIAKMEVDDWSKEECDFWWAKVGLSEM